LFGALEDFRADVAESQGQLTGELRLGLIDNSVTHDSTVIREAIAEFARLAPEAALSVYVGGAVELEQQVLDDRLHVGIGLFHHELESLEYTPLFDEDHMLYCSSSHEFYELDDSDISAEMVSKAKYASWGHGESLPGWQPPFPLNEVASSPYVEGAAYLVLSGSYVSYLPTHFAGFWVRRDLMRPILPELTRRSVQFNLIRRKSARISRLMKVFLQQIGIETGDKEA
jgi:DNA-binding transcriptional LysR family regulator